MPTPVKKSLHGDLAESEKKFDRDVSRIRYVVERAIANQKTWRVLHTDYRRPYRTFPETITAVTALEFDRNNFE